MSPAGRPASGDSTPKTIRKRTAPKHLWMKLKRALNAAGTIASLIKAIEDLAVVLPSTVAEGTDEDEIHRVLTRIHGHDEEAMMDSTFNRRFDCHFKEDAQCRDMNGRLHLIRRGEVGMSMVVRYL
ncbi:hypothetical protein B0H14DRAFT_3514808 [Mycena olivaceomarginata]|nr:hypothetical protein B0H14DRAFT_3514808 [Mycena olivaceomarginata]